MTIGIALILEDGVLLVADGRRIRPMSTSISFDDNVNKICAANESIASISFGITQGTDIALDCLSLVLPRASSISDVRSYVERSVNEGWGRLISSLSSSVDRNHHTMRVALITGGLFGERPFLIGALRHPDGQSPTILQTESFNCLVLGGEEQGAQEDFISRAARVISQPHLDRGTEVVNSFVWELLVAAKDTIRIVEASDRSVGGTIHYTVIRRGFPLTVGQL